MKGSAQTALAIGVGYVLGRRRKMRLATMLAVGAATGGMGKLGPIALKRGAKLLSSTELAGALGPQVSEIVSTIRGDLLDAGKAAATAAVSGRIDSLSDSLRDRADALRHPEDAVAGAGKAAGRAGETVGRLRRRGRVADAEDVEDAELDGDEEPGDGRGRRERARPHRSARSEEDDGRGPEDEYDEYGDEEPDEYETDEAAAELDEVPADEVDEPEDPEDLDTEDSEEPAPRRKKASRSPVTRTRR